MSRLWNSQAQTWNNHAQAQTNQPLAPNNPQAGKSQPQSQNNQFLAQINLPQALKKGRRWSSVNISAESAQIRLLYPCSSFFLKWSPLKTPTPSLPATNPFLNLYPFLWGTFTSFSPKWMPFHDHYIALPCVEGSHTCGDAPENVHGRNILWNIYHLLKEVQKKTRPTIFVNYQQLIKLVIQNKGPQFQAKKNQEIPENYTAPNNALFVKRPRDLQKSAESLAMPVEKWPTT